MGARKAESGRYKRYLGVFAKVLRGFWPLFSHDRALYPTVTLVWNSTAWVSFILEAGAKKEKSDSFDLMIRLF